jgi:imidazolonepropionase-like amidohydrolase
MRPLVSRLALAATSTLTAWPVAAQAPEVRATASAPVTALVGATLVNPGARPLRDAVVVVRGQRIACAGGRAACAVPAGARVVDVGAADMIPGLVDAHVH